MIDVAGQVLTNIENTPSSPSKRAKISSTPVISAAAISTLRVKKLSPDATLPKRGSERAAGYDLARWDLCIPYMGPIPPTLFTLISGRTTSPIPSAILQINFAESPNV